MTTQMSMVDLFIWRHAQLKQTWLHAFRNILCWWRGNLKILLLYYLLSLFSNIFIIDVEWPLFIDLSLTINFSKLIIFVTISLWREWSTVVGGTLIFIFCIFKCLVKDIKWLIIVRWRSILLLMKTFHYTVLTVRFLIISIAARSHTPIYHFWWTLCFIEFRYRHRRRNTMHEVVSASRTQPFVNLFHYSISVFLLYSHNIHVFDFIVKRWISFAPVTAEIRLPL
jgi:hypothetical protein